MEIWAKVANMSACHNLAVLALAGGSFKTAFSYAERLYADYADAFLAKVAGDLAKSSRDELVGNFIDGACPREKLASVMDLLPASWKEIAASRLAPDLIAEIRADIARLKTRCEKGWRECQPALDDFKSAFMPHFERLRSLYPGGSLQLSAVADEAALEVNSAAVQWNNDTDAIREPAKILPYIAWAQSLPLSSAAAGKLQESLKTMREIVASLPEEEIVEDFVALKRLLERHDDKSSVSSSQIKELVSNATPYLASMKRKVGADNRTYKNITNSILSRVYNFVGEVHVQKLTQALKEMELYGPYGYEADRIRREAKSLVRDFFGIMDHLHGKVDADYSTHSLMMNIFGPVADAMGVYHKSGTPTLNLPTSPRSSSSASSSAYAGSNSETSSGQGCFGSVMLFAAASAGLIYLAHFFC